MVVTMVGVLRPPTLSMRLINAPKTIPHWPMNIPTWMYMLLWHAKVDLTCHSKSIFSKFSNFLYCLENEQWFLPFTSSLFQIHFSTDSLSHLNIISLFILYYFFIIIYSSYIHSQRLYFSMKNIISTTFFVIFSQESHQNLMWKVVTNSNLNPPLKLFFYSSILVNNNLLLKNLLWKYCGNIS